MNTNKKFSIDNNIIGDGRCFIIAEIAQAHDGSLGAAHAYIDAVAEAGADAIKFQTHIASEESTPDEGTKKATKKAKEKNICIPIGEGENCW